MAYPWNVTYNGGGLESFGLAISQGYFYFDALALTTFGFIYGAGSVWPVADDCYPIVWETQDECVPIPWVVVSP